MIDWGAILLFAGGIVTAIGGAVVARYTAKSTVKAKQVEVEANVSTRKMELEDAALERLESANVSAFLRMKEELIELKLASQEQKKAIAEQGLEISRLRESFEKISGVFRIVVNWVEGYLEWEASPRGRPRPKIPSEVTPYLNQSLLDKETT